MMGYGSYIDQRGRPAGYNVIAHCDARGCMERIDRGLGYMCGAPGTNAERHGCQKFFCTEHTIGVPELCNACNHKAPRCESCSDILADDSVSKCASCEAEEA